MTVTPTSRPEATTVATEARARGAHPHVINGAEHDGKQSMLDAIASALSFPDYFSHTLDALYACLTDLSWLPLGEHVLIWMSSDKLKQSDPKSYLAIHGVLSDSQRTLAPRGDHANGRSLTVVLAE